MRLEHMIDPTIHDCHRNLMLPRKHTYGGPPREKILNHLPGHFARKSRHPLPGDAMIGRIDHQLRLRQYRRCCPEYAAETNSKRLELPERALRLGFVIDLAG